MTEAEYLIKQHDSQIEQALTAYKIKDIHGFLMHRQMAEGFLIKYENLQLKQAEAWKGKQKRK